MLTGTLVAVVVLSAAAAAPAADHFVSPAGVATWGQSTDVGAPCSLETANASAQPGDTVHLLGGTYGSYVAPRRSGASAAEPITYRSAAAQQVTIAGTRYAIHLDSASYVSVQGIDFRQCQQFLVIRNGHHNDIGRCTFDLNRDESTWMGSWVHENSTYNRIHNCTFSRFGWVREGDDKGALLDIGYDTSTTDATDHNVIQDNLFYYGGHHLLHICGTNNVVRGNYFHNEAWMPCDRPGGCGNRGAMTIGPMAAQNLFEDNRFAFAGAPPDDNGADGLVIRSPGNIVRRNYCYGNGAAGIALHSMDVSIPSGNCIYSNTIFHNGYSTEIDTFWTGGIAFGNWGNGPLPGNVVINNILHGNWQGRSITGYGDAGTQQILRNWLDQGDPGFTDDRLPEDTRDAGLPDFTLRPESPCVDGGAFLTRVTSPAGAGVTFQVEDAGFFYDGWGIPGETGDRVQLEGQGLAHVVASVDYKRNCITLQAPLSWTPGQGVALAYRGAAPDLGARESAAGDPPSR